jgi:hypothetical protein
MKIREILHKRAGKRKRVEKKLVGFGTGLKKGERGESGWRGEKRKGDLISSKLKLSTKKMKKKGVLTSFSTRFFPFCGKHI